MKIGIELWKVDKTSFSDWYKMSSIRNITYRKIMAKKKVTKIGKRSIYDILNDKSAEMDTKEKINYIRHQFTYYDGNHDLFYTNGNKPNKKKLLLNRVISEVIDGNKEPSILKKFNKKILLWRKEKIEKLNKIRTAEELKQITDYTNHDWYIMTVKTSTQPKFELWKQKIIDFINSPENNLDPYLMKHITYKRLKNLVSHWEHSKKKDVDYNKELLRKYPIEFLIYRKDNDIR